MKFNVYAVRDSLSGYYPQLYVYKSDSIATRAMLDTLYAGKPTTTEKDLDVMCIGTIELDSGKLSSVDPVLVVQGLSVHQKKLGGESNEISNTVQ